ncbi:MAG: 5-(carboxyamino)imidazole ribonucleotide mutase [Clostridia bacterium]|nr:5-(carboxyamino)imidazole ribonucleotide mutase [Clostridia bacterium]
MSKPLVGIIMGSDSDLAVMKGAADILDHFEVGYDVIVASAHRAPEKVHKYATTAEERGIRVIIAGAGVAAHLPGVIAAVTPLPVIGVPIFNVTLDGVDALYSIVQMPPGVPVAAVGINNAKNAGILAAQILSIHFPELREKLKGYKKQLEAEVEAKDAKLQQLGIAGYLAIKGKK